MVARVKRKPLNPVVRADIDIAVGVYSAMIRDRVHFAEASYGDGEWGCMLKGHGRNCNGEVYTPELGAMLRQTLTEPTGQWCIFWYPHPTIGVAMRKRAKEWIAKHKPEVHWIPHRCIARANNMGEARPLFEAFSARRVILVGPSHLSGLTLFPVAHHITVPDAVAWKHMDRLVSEIEAVLRPDDLVLFAAGMATNVMIWRLWKRYRKAVTLIDVGAALDPYVGHWSRGTHNSDEWRENMMPRNLPRAA